MPSRIVKVEVSRRGPQGSIAPADQARIDAAAEIAETITAVVQTATDAQAGAVAAAGQSSGFATAAQQAAATAAVEAAEAVAPAAADAIRAQVATYATQAQTAATSVETTKGRLDTLSQSVTGTTGVAPLVAYENGRIAIGQRDDGLDFIPSQVVRDRLGIAGLEDSLTGLSASELLQESAGAPLVAYEDGRVAIAQKSDGLDFVPSGDLLDRFGITDAPAGAWAAEIGADGVTTFSADAGVGRVDRFRLLPSGWAPTAREAIVMAHYGQSNAGVTPMGETKVWTAPPAPWHVMTPNDRNSANTYGGVEGWAGIMPGFGLVNPTGLVPATDIDVQSIVTAAGARLVDVWDGPVPPVVVCKSAGWGAQAFIGTSESFKGLHRDINGAISPAFTNLLNSIRDMTLFARAMGYTVTRAFIPFSHQEAEAQLSRADYLARWVAFKADFEAALAALNLGVSLTWLVDQGGGTTAAATGNAWQPRLSIYDATLPANGGANVVMVQPRYWIPLGMSAADPAVPDAIHHSYIGRVLQGELTAYCVRELMANRPWRCAWPAAVTVNGSAITLDFDSITPLTLDRSYIPIRPNLGFELRATTATISSVTQTDARRIVLQCSASPAGGFVRYAFHNSAGEPWDGYTTGTGALREVWQAESRFIGGRMLYRPALGFEWPL